jgi:hypothetical protein
VVLGVRATEVWRRRLALLTANLTAKPTDRAGFCGTQRTRKRPFSSAKRKGGIQRTPPSRTLNLRAVATIPIVDCLSSTARNV